MAPFIVSPASVDDVPDMVQVYNSAFEHNYFSSFTFPKEKVPQDIKNEWLAEKYTTSLRTPGIETFVCRDNISGEVAGFARWGYPVVLTDAQKEEKKTLEAEAEQKRKNGIAPYPSGANVECCDAKFLGLEKIRDKHVDYEDMYGIRPRPLSLNTIRIDECPVVHFLGVHQKYQGKGVGTLLLKNGLNLADVQGRRTYIEATDAGRRLYLKLGWEEIDVLRIDIQKWGGSKPGTNYVMMRDPQVLGA
ncbi:hypothetical protein BP5796_00340 [Coleophoma crateriformis]|uniref:N-acetyltransferase domain-containing protein n=1 Tax=Coleophoma crateriformis TaxID=565419 RepID=A0A3D8T7N8_9HELO|nr:hypothetical protein BP5796_00340 [Coleophoma crateriformis]